jgi:hypothetical protein
VRGPSQDRVRAAGILAASLLATLINPYGWQMWQLVFRVGHLTRNLMEWGPLSSASIVNRVAVVACVVAVLALWRRLPFERVVTVVGLGYAAYRAKKFDGLCVATTVLFLSPLIVAKFPRELGVVTTVPPAIRLITTAGIAGLGAFAVVNAWPDVSCLTTADWRPDPTAAAALTDARPSGRIVVTFDWGEYVIWQFGPKLRVSFDPRFDLVYSERTIAEQVAVRAARPEGIAFLKRTQPEYVWFRQSDRALKNWLSTNGYRLDVETSTSFVAVRQDLPPVHNPGSQAPGCFPAT